MSQPNTEHLEMVHPCCYSFSYTSFSVGLLLQNVLVIKSKIMVQRKIHAIRKSPNAIIPVVIRRDVTRIKRRKSKSPRSGSNMEGFQSSSRVFPANSSMPNTSPHSRIILFLLALSRFFCYVFYCKNHFPPPLPVPCIF